MSNYRIIEDAEALQQFIDWLPEINENETYYLSLFARKKYCQELIKSNDKTQLKRFTSNKEGMLQNIKQLECAVGSYQLADKVAPQQSLVLYIHPNPRNTQLATFKLLRKCIDLLEAQAKGYNLHAEALSAIQKAKSKSYFVDFDIDTKDVDLSIIKDILPAEAYRILETRGGYHLLVQTAFAPKTKWHQQIREAFDVDVVGDQMIPVPGCVQGGFVPRFVEV
ncbi:hypothetical protein GC194_01305 [bacterium]|nr:hypothetical protein [bacterium]